MSGGGEPGVAFVRQQLIERNPAQAMEDLRYIQRIPRFSASLPS
jgi:hypothetical protein